MNYVLIGYGGLMANALFAVISGIIITTNIIIGALITALYVYLLANSLEDYRVFIVVWNVVTVISMCAGRIIFTARAKKSA